MLRSDLTKFLCPLCGSDPVVAGKLRHCSNVGCKLNQADVPEAQWENRPLEDELICDNDRLRELVSKQNSTVMQLGGQIKCMQERDKRERAERRIAWLKKRHDQARRFG